MLFKAVIHCGALKITHSSLNKNKGLSDYYLQEHSLEPPEFLELSPR